MRGRNSYMPPLAALVLALVLSSPPLLCAKLSPQEKEQQREQKAADKAQRQQAQAQSLTRAREHIAEGEKLERDNHLLEAQYEYLDAEQEAHTKDGSQARKRVNGLIESGINRLVHEARGLYEHPRADEPGRAEDYTAAIKKLEEAQKYDPDRLLLNYDLAIIHRALGDLAGRGGNGLLRDSELSVAIYYLDQCLYVLPEGRKRDELELMRAQIVTPENLVHVPDSVRDDIEKIDRFRQTDDKGYHDAERNPEAGREPCALLTRSEMPQLPSVLFNKARCLETGGQNPQAAAQSLEVYLNSATEALDREQEESHLSFLKSVASVPGPQGKQLQTYYSEAARYLDVGRYDLVSRELSQAERTLPTFCETKWRLALFYDAFGLTADARQHLVAYLQCAANEEQREQAVSKLESLDTRRAKYDLAVQDARQPLTEVVQAYVKYGRNTRQRYVRDRLDIVFRDLGQAISFFPLGIEAHELLAMVYELTNNPRLAKRSFDVLWTQGRTVTFFDSGGRRIEIQGDRFRIIDAPDTNATHLASSLRDGIPRQAVKEIEVHEDTIIVVLTTGSSVSIIPARLAMPASPKGPLARKYTNQYALLFRRYLGVDPIALGKEGLTRKETVQIGWDVFAIAFSAYSVTQAAKVSNYTQNITNLIFYASNAASVSYTVKDMYSLLQQQHQIAQDAPFKTIPTSQARFEFREKF